MWHQIRQIHPVACQIRRQFLARFCVKRPKCGIVIIGVSFSSDQRHRREDEGPGPGAVPALQGRHLPPGGAPTRPLLQQGQPSGGRRRRVRRGRLAESAAAAAAAAAAATARAAAAAPDAATAATASAIVAVAAPADVVAAGHVQDPPVVRERRQRPEHAQERLLVLLRLRMPTEDCSTAQGQLQLPRQRP